MTRSVRKSAKAAAKQSLPQVAGTVAELVPPGKPAATEAKPAGRGLHDQLARLGLARDQDLVLHLPLRYEDHTAVVPLVALKPGLAQQAEGTVVNADIRYRPRRQLVCLLEDGDDGGARAQLVLRFFHFYPSQQKALAPGRRLRVFGEVRDGHFGREIVHPQFKVVEPGAPLPDRLTPVYPTTAGLAQETLRKVIARALASDPALVAESLPDWLVARRHLWRFSDAVRFLHAPPPRLSRLTQHALDERTHPAWTRLKFDELVAQQLSLKAHRKARAARRAPVLTGTGALTGALLGRVPFKLTRAQERVWREIGHDLKRAMPMQRLLQGDVGSGKTIIAALAALQAIESGRQVAFMAPTEILAEQHFRKLAHWLDGLPVELAWLSGGLPAKARKKALAAIASGDAMFAIGTHALFEDEVLLPRLGLAIVDEQHRFGVAQRLKLRGKAMGEAHQLMMSATPIPRTLAMTFYADLDVSTLDEMPPGRTPVATRLVNNKRRGEVIVRVRRACAGGRQAYWVCPLIEESEKLELQTAAALHAELTALFSRPEASRSDAPDSKGPGSNPADADTPLALPPEGGAATVVGPASAGRSEAPMFPVGPASAGRSEAPMFPVGPASAGRSEAATLEVGLLHGRMKPDEKAAVMADFVAGKIRVLVATTVIEVGVDVPNASLMVIEHAERFGLAQLHQLRGRVGRGATESTCYLLFEEPLTDTAKARLKVIYESNDGFEIARQDLVIRGPGEFLGAKQSGVPLLRFADLEKDVALIEQARDAADELLQKDPAAADAHLQRWLGGRQEFFKA